MSNLMKMVSDGLKASHFSRIPVSLAHFRVCLANQTPRKTILELVGLKHVGDNRSFKRIFGMAKILP